MCRCCLPWSCTGWNRNFLNVWWLIKHIETGTGIHHLKKQNKTRVLDEKQHERHTQSSFTDFSLNLKAFTFSVCPLAVQFLLNVGLQPNVKLFTLLKRIFPPCWDSSLKISYPRGFQFFRWQDCLEIRVYAFGASSRTAGVLCLWLSHTTVSGRAWIKEAVMLCETAAHALFVCKSH